jgi:hypothetical protein
VVALFALWINVVQDRDKKTPAAVRVRTALMRKRRHFVNRVRAQLFRTVGTGIVRGCNRYSFDTGIRLKALERLNYGGVLSKVSLTVYTMTGLVR